MYERKIPHNSSLATIVRDFLGYGERRINHCRRYHGTQRND